MHVSSNNNDLTVIENNNQNQHLEPAHDNYFSFAPLRPLKTHYCLCSRMKTPTQC